MERGRGRVSLNILWMFDIDRIFFYVVVIALIKSQKDWGEEEEVQLQAPQL
jgi:hypothetical protein